MLAALEMVDFVAVNHSPTGVDVIEIIRPHFYVKGPDYRNMAADPTGAIVLEQQAAEKQGGKLVFTEDETYSSSALINQFFSNWSDAQIKAISEVKKAGGLDVIHEVLEKLEKERVAIVGEPIVDTYVFCQAEAVSSKSPSISARYLHEENYAGEA